GRRRPRAFGQVDTSCFWSSIPIAYAWSAISYVCSERDVFGLSLLTIHCARIRALRQCRSQAKQTVRRFSIRFVAASEALRGTARPQMKQGSLTRSVRGSGHPVAL